MEHYVTLFDSKYLPQGLSLYRSMERWCGDFTLWVICMDELAKETLAQLNYKSLELISLSEFEIPALLQVKSERTVAEYCWTITPFVVEEVWKRTPGETTRVTYVDADMYFLASPAPIFTELDDSHAVCLITEHAFSPEFDESTVLGRFCVQFMPFVFPDCSPILSLWKSQCLEWCSAIPDSGRFGDQKYLDDWPTLFPGRVHVLKQRGLLIGPWNASRFPYSEAVTYHMQGVRITRKFRLSIGDFPLPHTLLSNVYIPYAKELRESLTELEKFNFDEFSQSKPPGLRKRMASIARWGFRSWRRNRSAQTLPF